jgi:hypothetical protein
MAPPSMADAPFSLLAVRWALMQQCVRDIDGPACLNCMRRMPCALGRP